MAAVVRSKQTGSGASGTLSGLTAATAGNLLVLFINESASIVNAPKPKDNISGETGWTVNETKGIYATSLNSLWVATKVAVGGETTIEATPGVGATLEGMIYFECSGLTATMDQIVHTDNSGGGSKAITSPSVTTADAGDVILAAVGSAAASGTVQAWTGTGPITSAETTSTRCLGGSYVPGATVSGVTFTANWANAHVCTMLLVALKPAEAATGGHVATVI